MMNDRDTHSTHRNGQPRISCTKCSYDLAGLDLTGNCPECGTKIITNCYQCNYLLDGLDPSGQCPECGFPISDSVGRGVLSRCDPAYLARLHRGVVMIQTAIILMIFHEIGSVLVGFTRMTLTRGLQTATVVMMGLGLLITLLFVAGWLRFSTPNPERDEMFGGSKARRWIRVMLVLTVLSAMLKFITNLLADSYSLYSFVQIASLIGIAIFAVRFYSEMLYIRWMAPLLRNTRAHKRTTTLMWMGPAMLALMIAAAFLGFLVQPAIGVTVGILILVGALAMLIMYWNMLDWIRKDLKAIRAAH